MKKKRGLKRYYCTLRRKVANMTIDFSSSSWFDMWHIHLDNIGVSNRNHKSRQEHFRLYFDLFDRVKLMAKKYENDVQIWLHLNIGNGYEDALYIHSPNPNNTIYSKFPYTFSKVQWDVEIPEGIKPFFDKTTMRIGAYRNPVFTDFVIINKIN